MLPSPTVFARTVKTVAAMMMPTTHPSRNPALVPPALGASSIRIVAMIGTGLIATPTASGRISPMTVPTRSSWCIGYCGSTDYRCSGQRLTQRKPRWLVEVSTVSPWRAAGR